MKARSISLRLAMGGMLLAMSATSLSAASSAAPPAGLVDQTGRAFDEAAMRKGWHLVYFGFTHCPEVCPTSLFEMTASLDLVPEASRKLVTPVFVTLDPARDTAQGMAEYVKPLGHGFVTVSGTQEAIDSFAAAHKIIAIRNGLPGEDYTVDHSSFVLLLDPAGQEIERFPYAMDYREVAERIAAHLDKTAAAAPALAAAHP